MKILNQGHRKGTSDAGASLTSYSTTLRDIHAATLCLRSASSPTLEVRREPPAALLFRRPSTLTKFLVVGIHSPSASPPSESSLASGGMTCGRDFFRRTARWRSSSGGAASASRARCRSRDLRRSRDVRRSGSSASSSGSVLLDTRGVVVRFLTWEARLSPSSSSSSGSVSG